MPLLKQTFPLIIILFCIFLTTDTAHTASIEDRDIQIITEQCGLQGQTYHDLKTGINKILKVYTDYMGFSYPKDFLVKIRIFGDYQHYEEYRNKVTSYKFEYAFFSRKLKEMVLWKKFRETDIARTVIHECSHLLIHLQFKRTPSWLNEGLAECFENLKIEGPEIEIPPHKTKDRWCKHWVRKNSIMDIHFLLNMSNKEWKKSDMKSRDVRTLSWSIVYFLLSRKDGKELIEKALFYFEKKYKTKGASIYFFELYYPGGITQFEKDWHEWIPGPRSNLPL